MARWADLVGTGELLRQLQARWDALARPADLRRSPGDPSSDRFEGAIEAGVETLVRARVAEATAAEAWRLHPAGVALLARVVDDLTRPSDLPERRGHDPGLAEAGLLDLLRTEGADKRSTARAAGYGVSRLPWC